MPLHDYLFPQCGPFEARAADERIESRFDVHGLRRAVGSRAHR